MKIPNEFNAIRPYEPEELPEVYERLIGDPQFKKVIAIIMPGVPYEAVAAKIRACKTNYDFQVEFCYKFLEQLLSKASTSCNMDISAVDADSCYTFMSNHRDIVLDSALLDKLLVDYHFTTTCEIAIGDNLLSMGWVRDLVGINKAFVVQRNLPPMQKLRSSARLSEYMHFAINKKHENLWIAQREGRAKDSNDVTQTAILKMMTLGGEGSLTDRLLALHIVPLSISYEYDPCDFLKAKEFQQKRDMPDFHKGPMDDIVSMRTGIMGFKGNIHYHCAPCIDDFLRSMPKDMSKSDTYTMIAERIDHEIHRNYRIYPVNYVALDMLKGTSDYASNYTKEDKEHFDSYVESQLKKVDLENPDHDYLRERILTMYANPLINHIAAK